MIHCQIDRFETWCHIAVDLLRQDAVPQSIRWEQVPPHSPFFGLAAAADRSRLLQTDLDRDHPLWLAAQGARRLPDLLLQRVERAACHRDPAKWDLFYRLLWRSAHGEGDLVKHRSDADVRRLIAMRRSVTVAARQMHGEVVFCPRLPGADDYALAWHRPQHAVLRVVAPYFVRKFLVDKWALLTPDESAEWDGHVLQFGPGVTADAPPRPEQLVALWREYQQHSFRPDRLTFRGPTAVDFRPPAAAGGASAVLVTSAERSADEVRSADQILAEALTDVGIDPAQVKLIHLSDPATDRDVSGPQQRRKPTQRRMAERRRRLELELGHARPRMLVLMGAVAAQTLLGRDFRVSRQHGQVFASPWAPWTMATYHPAALVGVPDLTVRARMQEQFLYDLHRLAEELGRQPSATPAG